MNFNYRKKTKIDYSLLELKHIQSYIPLYKLLFKFKDKERLFLRFTTLTVILIIPFNFTHHNFHHHFSFRTFWKETIYYWRETNLL